MVDAFAPTPIEVYYPSLVINLALRLDEGPTSASPKTIRELADAGTAPPASTEEPDVLIKDTTDNLSHILGIVPYAASVELPSYRQAGTFSITLAFRDLPLDPRVIRALGVDVHLGTVDAGRFGDGMTQVPVGKRPSILDAIDENLLVSGTADTIDVEHGRRGSLVHIEGRDLRGIMLDASLDSRSLAQVDLSKPIDQVVAQILNLVPQGAAIPVDVKASEWPGGSVPSPGVQGDLTRVNTGCQGDRQVPTAKGNANTLKFWDIITQYCFLVGGIPHFVGKRLRIRPARSLFDAQLQEETFDTNVPTPFANGARRRVSQPLVSTDQEFAFRRIVYGNDIDTLRFERKLGGTKVPVIEVVSVDTSSEERGEARLLIAQHPPETDADRRQTSEGPGGATPQTDVLRIPVPGIRSKERLAEIAKDLFEEIGRQEIGGSVETRSLASFGGTNQDPDLLTLRPGDPIELLVDGSGLNALPPPISELTNEAARSIEEQVREVAQRIGDETLARALVNANRGTTLQRVFRTSNVRFDWDKETGVSIAFDFQNYVEARYAETVAESGTVGFA